MSKTWTCPEGCSLGKTPCKHLERLLPPMWEQAVRVIDISTASIDVFSVQFPRHSVESFEYGLKSAGFTDPWDIEILTARYYHSMSYRRIAEEYSYVSFETVRRRINKLHMLLLERGLTVDGLKKPPREF